MFKDKLNDLVSQTLKIKSQMLEDILMNGCPICFSNSIHLANQPSKHRYFLSYDCGCVSIIDEYCHFCEEGNNEMKLGFLIRLENRCIKPRQGISVQ